MSTKELLDRLRTSSAILETVARGYLEQSPEREAVEFAARGLVFACTDAPERFAAFLKDFDADLTPEQKANLVRLGIKPEP